MTVRSSSSSVQALLVFVALASQSGAFNPANSYRRGTSANGFCKINRQAPIAVNSRNYDRLSMNIDGDKNKGLAPLQAATANLDTPQESTGNPISRWVLKL